MKVRIFRLVGFGALVCAQAVGAAPISRSSLVQYQYNGNPNDCSVTLANGLHIEFDGVFANEGDYVVAHRLVILRIKTKKYFGIATVLKVSSYDDAFLAKVVRQDADSLYIALDSSFLNLLWGSEGVTSFEIEEVNKSLDSPRESFLSPPDMKNARVLISNGLSCFEDLDKD